MVQLEQYDASPIVTVDTDANTEVNLKFSCDKIPLIICINVLRICQKQCFLSFFFKIHIVDFNTKYCFCVVCRVNPHRC